MAIRNISWTKKLASTYSSKQPNLFKFKCGFEKVTKILIKNYPSYTDLLWDMHQMRAWLKAYLYTSE